MKQSLFALAVLLSVANPSFAQMSIVQPWTPVYKGIDHAIGTNNAPLQSVNCMRIDLTDPDIKLFHTPRSPNWGIATNETRSLIVSNFLRNYHLQLATDCNFYGVTPGGSDPTAENLPSDVHGMAICTGAVVSLPDNYSRWASLLFTTDNVPYLNFTNRVQGTNGMNAYNYIPGIYTAVSGFYPVLTNNVIWDAATLSAQYPDATIHGYQPRTSFGFSADKHYLYMVTIDGRQSWYSNGATDQETAAWMLLFGASDAIIMDGGGSTAMYRADCAGNPVAINHSSYVAAGRGRERIIGSHFGVYAKELYSFITDVAAVPGGTTATITWLTASNASSQVEYGLSPSYGTLSLFDPDAVTSHSITLSGLTPGTRYYYRVISVTDTDTYRSSCGGPFSTTNIPGTILISLTNMWSYTSSNMDGINWTSADYDDQYWSTGAGVHYVDTTYPTGNPAIQFLPLRTQMPYDPTSGPPYYPYITYYFRSYFNFEEDPTQATLTFTALIDDGVAFYLNGVRIKSIYLPDGAINSTLANGYYCTGGNANCSNIFSIPGDLLQRENTLAVEVHNYNAHSPDVTFGLMVAYTLPPAPPQFIVDVRSTATQSNAVVSWATISNSTSQVFYGTTTNYGFSTAYNLAMVTNHSANLTGLSPNTTYYYKVVSTVDTNGYSAQGMFNTLPMPPPPFFTNINVLPSSYSATLNWETISNSSSQVEYGLTALLGTLSPLDNTPVTSHSVTLSGFLPSTNYYYRLISVVNGTTFSTNGIFTTLPAPIYNLMVDSGLTTATISWLTLSNATSQIMYGLTPSLELSTPVDSTLTTTHSFALSGLQQATNYYFRVVSSVGATQWVSDGTFSTYYKGLLPLTNSWNYSYSNYNGVPWTSPDFDDSAWVGGPALIWADSRPYGPTTVQPKNTRIGINTNAAAPYYTYYFRTHLTNTAGFAGCGLVFSNFIDDGAVFYANGTEIYRLRMPASPAVIMNGTFATGKPVSDDAISADVFRIGGEVMTNFVAGDNVLAVEVHNCNSTSPDITFGSSIGLVPAFVSEIRLSITTSNDLPVVSWPGQGYILQQANILTTDGWSDVPGPATSPYTITNPAVTTFYRLRN